MSNLTLKNNQINKYRINNAIVIARCHFKNLNTRRFWDFALERIGTLEKMHSTQNFYINDDDFFNNHSMIKSKKISKEKIMQNIINDIKDNNFYQAFQMNPIQGTPNISIASVITREKIYQRTFIRFNKDFVDFANQKKVKTKDNAEISSYTELSKDKLLKCKNNEIYDFYKLLKRTQHKGVLEVTIKTIRYHFVIPKDKLKSTYSLTQNLKRKCRQINEYKDIKVFFETIKINNKTVGYRFKIKPNKPQSNKPQKKPQSNKPQATIIQRMMRFKIKGKAVVRLKSQYSDNEIEAGLFVLEGYDPNQITSSNFSFLIGVIQNQTGRKYAL